MSVHYRKKLVALSLMSLALPAISMAGGGSSTKYKTRAGGKIEFYPNGRPKSMQGRATCTGVKIQVSAPGKLRMAVGVPTGATIAGVPEMYADNTLSAPLEVDGEEVVMSPSASVASEAEAFEPAGVGFEWVGFESQDLLVGTSGPMKQEGTYVIFFNDGDYPGPTEISPHVFRIFIGDNAETVESVVQRFLVYGPETPTISEWGLIGLILLVVTAGTVLLIRRRAAIVS